MPSTNLDFNVVAHTGQALGEIRLLKAQIQDLGRTLRAAVKAGDTAGAQAISQNIGSLEAQLLGLNKALGGTTGAMGGFSLASTRTMRSLLTFRGSIVSLTQSLGGGKAGLAIRGGPRPARQIAGSWPGDRDQADRGAGGAGDRPQCRQLRRRGYDRDADDGRCDPAGARRGRTIDRPGRGVAWRCRRRRCSWRPGS